MTGALDRATGSPLTFCAALTLVLVGWLDVIPWQAVDAIATAGTFLIAFGLHRKGTTDKHAMQAKLDELIAATDAARNDLLHIEDAPDKVIDEVRSSG